MPLTQMPLTACYRARLYRTVLPGTVVVKRKDCQGEGEGEGESGGAEVNRLPEGGVLAK